MRGGEASCCATPSRPGYAHSHSILLLLKATFGTPLSISFAANFDFF